MLQYIYCTTPEKKKNIRHVLLFVQNIRNNDMHSLLPPFISPQEPLLTACLCLKDDEIRKKIGTFEKSRRVAEVYSYAIEGHGKHIYLDGCFIAAHKLSLHYKH